MAITRRDTTDATVHDALARHYQNEGLPSDAWHIGPEHPALERAALEVLDTLIGRKHCGDWISGRRLRRANYLRATPGSEFSIRWCR